MIQEIEISKLRAAIERKQTMQTADYEWLDSMKICHRCKKARQAPGRKFCFDCLDRIREENAKRYDPEKAKRYQARRREIYQEKKKNGVCVRCSKPATHGIYCYEHSINAKRRSQRRAEERKRIRHKRGLIPDERKDKGLCLWCGENALPGLRCCEKHSNIFSEAGKRGKKDKEVKIWRRI